jgi:uncharacterized protein (DUF58 family)
MDTLLQKVRKLEIKVKSLVDTAFAGEYQSAFRGQGLEFSEVRAYQLGDDIRSIDWNVTARSNSVYIKQFREEREQQIFVLFDISGSEDFGAETENKRMIGTELAAIFAFSSLRNNDRFGLITFSNGIEQYFKPLRGRSHIMAILQGLIKALPNSKKTDIKAAIDYYKRVQKRKSVMILISDFLDQGYEDSIRQLSIRHEIILIRLYHPEEILKASAGIIPILDNESGIIRWVNSGGGAYRKKVGPYLKEIDTRLSQLARHKKIAYLPVDVSKDYVPVLEKFFNTRHASLKR